MASVSSEITVMQCNVPTELKWLEFQNKKYTEFNDYCGNCVTTDELTKMDELAGVEKNFFKTNKLGNLPKQRKPFKWVQDKVLLADVDESAGFANPAPIFTQLYNMQKAMQKEKDEDIANVMKHYIRIYKTIQYARYAGTEVQDHYNVLDQYNLDEFDEQRKHVNAINAQQIRKGIEERIRNNPSKSQLLSGLKKQLADATEYHSPDFICMQEGNINLAEVGYTRYGGDGDCSIYAHTSYGWKPIKRSEMPKRRRFLVKGQPKGDCYTRGFTNGTTQVQVVSMHLPSSGNTKGDHEEMLKWAQQAKEKVVLLETNPKEFNKWSEEVLPHQSVYAQACNALLEIHHRLTLYKRPMICGIDTNTKNKFDTSTTGECADPLFRSNGDNRDLTELCNPWWLKNYVEYASHKSDSEKNYKLNSKTMNQLEQDSTYDEWYEDNPNVLQGFTSQGPTTNKTRGPNQFQTPKIGKTDNTCKDVILYAGSLLHVLENIHYTRWIGKDVILRDDTLPVLPNKDFYSDHAWVIGTVKSASFDYDEAKIDYMNERILEAQQKERARLEQEEEEEQEQETMAFRTRIELDQEPSTSTSTSLRPGDRTFRFLDE